MSFRCECVNGALAGNRRRGPDPEQRRCSGKIWPKFVVNCFGVLEKTKHSTAHTFIFDFIFFSNTPVVIESECNLETGTFNPNPGVCSTSVWFFRKVRIHYCDVIAPRGGQKQHDYGSPPSESTLNRLRKGIRHDACFIVQCDSLCVKCVKCLQLIGLNLSFFLFFIIIIIFWHFIHSLSQRKKKSNESKESLWFRLHKWVNERENNEVINGVMWLPNELRSPPGRWLFSDNCMPYTTSGWLLFNHTFFFYPILVTFEVVKPLVLWEKPLLCSYVPAAVKTWPCSRLSFFSSLVSVFGRTKK